MRLLNSIDDNSVLIMSLLRMKRASTDGNTPEIFLKEKCLKKKNVKMSGANNEN